MPVKATDFFWGLRIGLGERFVGRPFIGFCLCFGIRLAPVPDIFSVPLRLEGFVCDRSPAGKNGTDKGRKGSLAAATKLGC